LEGHTKTIRQIAVCGERAVSASYDGEARVWDVGEGGVGKCLHVLKGHEGQLYTVAFEGGRIATGGLGAEVRVWDGESG
jgi:F-box and WD-40 domain protein CDC4